jgi:hypothetical protein
MKETLKPGLKHEHRLIVPPSKTVPALYLEAEEFLATSFECPTSGQRFRGNVWLACGERTVEVGGVTESAVRQQGIPGDHAAALPTKLHVEPLGIVARRVEHQQ